MKKRVLYVGNDASHFVSHRMPVVKAARAAGYEVHVAGPGGEAVSEIKALRFPYHEVPLSRSGRRPVEELRTLLALLRLYRKLKPDLVQHFTIKPVLYGGTMARVARVPAVVHVIGGLGYVFLARGPRAALLREGLKLVYRRSFGHPRARVVFQNPDDRDVFLRYGLVDKAKTAMIRGSGVDLSRFSPRPEPGGEPLVVLASRLLWDKGVGEFVEAARRLRAGGVRARFALVGGSDVGNPSAVPAARLEQWRDGGVVEWWGWQRDMPGVLARSSLACLPSYGEGVPKSLLEAAASGRAIVATDVHGCREVVRHGENGLLVPVRDPAALAEAMRTLLKDPALRRKMGERGRAIAEAEFSEERIAAETLGLYGELLA